jgi:hypothetical protein
VDIGDIPEIRCQKCGQRYYVRFVPAGYVVEE